MSKPESASEEVVDSFRVRNDHQGVNLTKIDLRDNSQTNLFMKNGRYKLVRVDDE